MGGGRERRVTSVDCSKSDPHRVVLSTQCGVVRCGLLTQWAPRLLLILSTLAGARGAWREGATQSTMGFVLGSGKGVLRGGGGGRARGNGGIQGATCCTSPPLEDSKTSQTPAEIEAHRRWKEGNRQAIKESCPDPLLRHQAMVSGTAVPTYVHGGRSREPSPSPTADPAPAAAPAPARSSSRFGTSIILF